MALEHLAVYAVCFLASLLGPLCGIGGGVIIKPVVDSLGLFPVAVVSFLSSASVLAMALATCLQNTIAGSWHVDIRSLVPIAAGSAVGGVLGKMGFASLAESLPDPEIVGGVQAVVLVALGAIVLVYTLRKHDVVSLSVSSAIARFAIGAAAGACWSFLGIGGGPFNLALVLVYTLRKHDVVSLSVSSAIARFAIGAAAGACWSFLGIGGGPFNLALLAFFFSMDSKPAAQASLFIIAFSQTAGVGYGIVSGGVPTMPLALLIGSCAAAVGGSVAGGALARRIESKEVDRLYIAALAVIIALSAWNAVRFLL